MIGDYYPNGKRWWFRLREKGGKPHDIPALYDRREDELTLDEVERIAI